MRRSIRILCALTAILILVSAFCPVLAQVSLSIEVNCQYPDGIHRTDGLLILRRNGLIRCYWIINGSGLFKVEARVAPGIYQLEVTSKEYESVSETLDLRSVNSFSDTVTFKLFPKPTMLNNIEIKSRITSPRISNDTIEFQTRSFKEPDVRKVDDLLQRIPGFNVGNDGRILYNGKEVHSILIDGEDLTGSDYKLISQNLSSAIIDKIQVVGNFNPNRLMKTMEVSDKIALNLLTDTNARKRPTGNITSGFGNAKRVLVDAGITRITRHAKLLAFVNHNNIGIAPSFTDASGFQSPDEASNKSYSNLTGPTVIPEPISQPFYKGVLSTTGAAVINGWSRKAIKYRTRISYGNQHSEKSNHSKVNVLPQSGFGWSLSDNEWAKRSETGIKAELSWSRDQGFERISTGGLKMTMARTAGYYERTTTGAFADSLIEDAINDAVSVMGRFGRTTRKRKGQLLNWDNRLDFHHSNSDVTVLTKRFVSFSGIDSSSEGLHQTLNTTTAMISSKVTNLIKSGNWQLRFRAALETSVKTMAFEMESVQSEYAPVAGNSHHYNQSGLSGSAAVLFGKGVRFQASYESEFTGNLYGGAGETHTTLSFSNKLTLLHKISRFRNFMLVWDYSNKVSGLDEFYKGPVLASSSLLQYGLTKPLTRPQTSVSFSYLSSNVFKARYLMVSGQVFQTDNENIPRTVLYPRYTVLSAAQGARTRGLNLQISGERFVAAVKSKITIQSNASFSKNRTSLNGDWISRRSGVANLEVKQTTAFKRCNFDFTFRKEFFVNSIGEPYHQGFNSTERDEWRLRFRWKPLASIKLLASYTVAQLSMRDNFFQALGLNLSYKCSRVFSMFVDCHNLMNTRFIVSRSLSDFSISGSSFMVMPRYVMFKIAADL